MIEEGRVQVNGIVVQELGTKVDDTKDKVVVGGRLIRSNVLLPKYVLLHKPKGVVTSAKDPLGRQTVIDLLMGIGIRVFPVGRLDADSSGVLLLTNDGEITNRLIHPKYGVKKIYEAEIDGELDEGAVEKLRRGVFVDGRKTAPAGVKIIYRSRLRSSFRVEMREGRKREVRRMFEAVGAEVRKLVRVEFAGLGLGNLKPGAWRYLSPSEVEELKKLAYGQPA